MSTKNDQRTLTIGQHLEELRAHVLRGVLSIVVFLVGALFFQDELMAVVVRPHSQASQAIAAARREALEASGGEDARLERLATSASELATLLDELAQRPLAERSEEERREAGRRAEKVASELLEGRSRTERGGELTFLTYQETFIAHLKLCFLAAIVLALPYLIWEIWRFIAEGLESHEQKYVRLFAPLSLMCFVGGVCFNYFILTPVSIRYLATYGSADLFLPSITVNGYLNLFFGLSLAMGLIFELPLAMVFLKLVRVVDAQKLRANRRYFLLLATVVAAVVTPTGDPWTLALATIPLLLLYEIGILAVRSLEGRE